MYNIIVLDKLNKRRLELFTYIRNNKTICQEPYSFSHLPLEEQFRIISEYQKGKDDWFIFILLGFWNFISYQYLKKVGTLSDSQLNVNNIEEEINEIIYKITKYAQNNDLKQPLGKQVNTNIKFMCLTFRKFHQFGYNVLKHQDEETVQKIMNIKRCTIDVYNHVEEIHYNPTDDIVNNIVAQDIFYELNNIIPKMDLCKNNPIYPKIIKMWLYGIVNDCGYEFKYIGKQYNMNRESIRQIIHKFKREMNENPICSKVYNLCHLFQE